MPCKHNERTICTTKLVLYENVYIRIIIYHSRFVYTHHTLSDARALKQNVLYVWWLCVSESERASQPTNESTMREWLARRVLDTKVFAQSTCYQKHFLFIRFVCWHRFEYNNRNRKKNMLVIWLPKHFSDYSPFCTRLPIRCMKHSHIELIEIILENSE